MLNILNAGTVGSDKAGQLGKSARPVADYGGKSRKPPVMDKALFDNTAPHGRVDIPSANGKHDLVTGELRQKTGNHGRKRRGRGPLHHRFF